MMQDLDVEFDDMFSKLDEELTRDVHNYEGQLMANKFKAAWAEALDFAAKERRGWGVT